MFLSEPVGPRQELARLGIALLLSLATLAVAFQMPGDIFVDFGPNDRLYVQGFRSDFENDEPTIIHWTTNQAQIELPFYISGSFRLFLRYKRHIASPAQVRLFRENELLDQFEVPQQDFVVDARALDDVNLSRARLRLLTQSEDPRPLGLALDWMSLNPSRQATIVPIFDVWIGVLGLLCLTYLVARVGLSSARAGLWALGVTWLLMLAAILFHKLWLPHVVLTIGLRYTLFVGAFLAIFAWRRRRPGSVLSQPVVGWALLVVYFATLIRVGVLFHPDYYYPDVRTHAKFVYAIWNEGLGGFLLNHIENQHRHLLGLQLVGGRWLAFPYPPILYLVVYPFTRLQLPVEEWMTLIMIFIVGAEALLLVGLSAKLGLSHRVGAVAAALHASSRLVAFRLAVASYAALFGHFIDLLAIYFLIVYHERLTRTRYGAGFAALVFLSLMSYAGSALVLGLFVPAAALGVVWLAPKKTEGTRPLARAMLVWSLTGALSAVTLFYLQYVPELLGSGAGGTDEQASELISLSVTPIAAWRMAAYRLQLFLGPAIAALFVAALIVASLRNLAEGRNEDSLGSKTLTSLTRALVFASVTTFLGLNFLRSGLGETHIFQFTKDVLVVLPLVCILFAHYITRLWQGRWSRALVVVFVGGWVVWSAQSFSNDVRRRFIRPDYPPGPALGRLFDSGESPTHAELAPP